MLIGSSFKNLLGRSEGSRVLTLLDKLPTTDLAAAFTLQDSRAGVVSESHGTYVNPVVELFRDSDGAERSFTDAELTNGVADAWRGAANAYVSKWYGSNTGTRIDATQSTADACPKLFDAATGLDEGLLHDLSDDTLVYGNVATISGWRYMVTDEGIVYFGVELPANFEHPPAYRLGEQLLADFVWSGGNPSGVLETLKSAYGSDLPGTSVTSLESAFRGQYITEIPPGLLDHVTQVTTLAYCFAYNQLQSLPSGLLDHVTQVTSLHACFYYNSLTSLPSGLLDHVTQVTSLRYCFANNSLTSLPSGLLDHVTQVTDLDACFKDNQLQSLPSGLLDHVTQVTDLYACFYDNSLTSLPSGLLDHVTQVTSLRYCFAYNSLTSLPSGLLDHVTQVTSLAYCFRNNQLQSLPSGLLDHVTQVTDLAHCFRDNSLTDVPAGIFDTLVNCADYASCFTGNALTQTSVDNILVSLDTAGVSNGTIGIDGGTNASPSATGLAAKSNLEAKGWTVNVN